MAEIQGISAITSIGTDSLRVALHFHRPQWCPALLLALAVAGCTSASLPKLEDLSSDATRPNATDTPHVGVAGPPQAESVPADTAKRKSARAGNEPAPVQPVRPGGGSDLIVAFKGPSIVLYDDANSNNGERVSVASLSLPLRMKSTLSNAVRVQIETPYGPRWIARSEITIGSDSARFGQR